MKAMDIAGQSSSALPQGQVLALPKELMNNLSDIGVRLRDIIEAS